MESRIVLFSRQFFCASFFVVAGADIAFPSQKHQPQKTHREMWYNSRVRLGDSGFAPGCRNQLCRASHESLSRQLLL